MIVLRFVPLIGLLFSMGIVTINFTLKDTPDLILRLIALLPLIVLLIHPVAVQFRFRWNRALFAGVRSASGEGEPADGPIDLPTTNTYEIEQRTFRRLGVRRTSELPIDLLLTPGVYFLFNLTTRIVFSGNLTEESDETNELIAGIVVATEFIVFLIMAVLRLSLRYKLRHASGYF